MQIKRFEAKTMTAALKLVKEEFGPEAVILSARSLRRSGGLFGAVREAGVEVTAAKDDGWADYTAANRPSAPEAPPAAEPAEVADRPGLLQTLNHRLRFRAGRRSIPAGTVSEGSPLLTELHRRILAQEVEQNLAAELMARVRRIAAGDTRPEPEGLRSHIGRVLQDMDLHREAAADSGAEPRIVVVVGPSGVGKTTTAMKIAAATMRTGREVALMTLDDHRIGAIEELRIFSRILGVPLTTAASAADSGQALQGMPARGCLIVDTPGISPGEETRRAELRQILEPLASRQVHLVLSASTREADLARMIAAWREFPVDRLLFTHLDEAGTCGSMLNLMIHTRIPVGYLSTGPRIPEDLMEGPLELLAARLWPATEQPAGRPEPIRPPACGTAALSGEDSPRFVANRNSDLYHRPDCKWVLKIKRGNLLQFTSAEAAEARHFSPCRNCTPGEVEGEAPSRGRRISGYHSRGASACAARTEPD